MVLFWATYASSRWAMHLMGRPLLIRITKAYFRATSETKTIAYFRVTSDKKVTQKLEEQVRQESWVASHQTIPFRARDAGKMSCTSHTDAAGFRNLSLASASLIEPNSSFQHLEIGLILFQAGLPAVAWPFGMMHLVRSDACTVPPQLCDFQLPATKDSASTEKKPLRNAAQYGQTWQSNGRKNCIRKDTSLPTLRGRRKANIYAMSMEHSQTWFRYLTFDKKPQVQRRRSWWTVWQMLTLCSISPLAPLRSNKKGIMRCALRNSIDFQNSF